MPESFLFMRLLGTMRPNKKVWTPLPSEIGITIMKSVMIGSRLLHYDNIVIPMAGISRRHARVFTKDGEWYLQDHGSDNGTWLLEPDQPKRILDEPTLIFDGMTVLFAAIVARFEMQTTLNDRLTPI